MSNLPRPLGSLVARALPRVAAGAACALAAGCGSGAPVAGKFTVDFPTLADAIATQTVQVFVYSYDAGMTCETLVEARRTTQTTPAGALAQTSSTTPCDLSKGTGTLEVGIGSFSFLAVGAGKDGDLFVGCSAQTISDTNSIVTIPLTLESNTVAVPATSCASLDAFCAKECQ